MVKCKHYKPTIIDHMTTHDIQYVKSGKCKLYHEIPKSGCNKESCPDFEPIR